MRRLTRPSCRSRSRRAFTLVELLVVISIVIIILTITLAAVDLNRESDKVRAGASQVQSFLRGAHDRAIYRNEPVGVRLFIDQAPPGSTGSDGELYTRTVTTMAYLGLGGTWGAPENSSLVNLERPDFNDDGDYADNHPTVPGITESNQVILVRGFNNPGWWNLKRRGWLVDGLRIRIPAGPTGNWYPISTALIDITNPPTDEQELLLQIPYADSGNKGQEVAWTNLTYEIELPWRILPEEPLILPDGVVIDLDASKLAASWRPLNSGNVRYSGVMDIIFSPRGSLIGDGAGAGILHLTVSDAEDARFLKEQYVAATSLAAFNTAIASGTPFVPMDEIAAGTPWLSTSENYTTKDRRIVSVFAQTGDVHVSVPNAFVDAGNTADPDTDGIANDPYRFAETGEVIP